MAAAFIMVAIADNADDFGFAFPSTETIAAKARCDVRTVYRYLDELEAEGWLRRMAKVINGRGNAYFLNLSKLGVTLSPDARRSPVHTALIRRHGDNLSRFFVPKESGDSGEISGDNPQPTQVTAPPSHVTKEGGSGDTRSHANHEPSALEPSGETSASVEVLPLPRSGVTNAPDETLSEANPEQLRRWDSFRMLLKEDLSAAPAVVAKRFSEVRPGVNDFDACFRDWWLVRFSFSPGPIEFITEAADVAATQAGVEKYHNRLVQRASLLFPIVKGDRVKFTVRQTAARELARAG
jgi:hypothetical protein